MSLWRSKSNKIFKNNGRNFSQPLWKLRATWCTHLYFWVHRLSKAFCSLTLYQLLDHIFKKFRFYLLLFCIRGSVHHRLFNSFSSLLYQHPNQSVILAIFWCLFLFAFMRLMVKSLPIKTILTCFEEAAALLDLKCDLSLPHLHFDVDVFFYNSLRFFRGSFLSSIDSNKIFSNLFLFLNALTDKLSYIFDFGKRHYVSPLEHRTLQ